MDRKTQIRIIREAEARSNDGLRTRMESPAYREFLTGFDEMVQPQDAASSPHQQILVRSA